MSEELLPCIVDLFVQGEQGRDRWLGGLGIGLTLARSREAGIDRHLVKPVDLQVPLATLNDAGTAPVPAGTGR